ncbi:MAG TPA: hypothetical protein VGL13_15695 [Polyangiaceae bacterium]|jgi:hypothetical protein
MYLVFSQDRRTLPDTELLAYHAARFFGAKVEVLEKGDADLRLRLTSSRPVFEYELAIRVRDVARGDLSDARDAESRGAVAGMAALAERCPKVWEIGPAPGSPEPSDAAYLTLAGVCASVALGPVLPPDRQTLFGVRGAMERREKIA